MGRRQAIDRGSYSACSHASKHHLLHIFERNVIVIQIFTEGSEQRSDRVVGFDVHGGLDGGAILNAHNLGRTAAHVYADY